MLSTSFFLAKFLRLSKQLKYYYTLLGTWCTKTLEILRLLFVRSKLVFCVTQHFSASLCANKNSWLKHKHQHEKIRSKFTSSNRGSVRKSFCLRCWWCSAATAFPSSFYLIEFAMESTNNNNNIEMKNYRIVHCSHNISTETFQSFSRSKNIRMTHVAHNSSMKCDQICVAIILYCCEYFGLKSTAYRMWHQRFSNSIPINIQKTHTHTLMNVIQRESSS